MARIIFLTLFATLLACPWDKGMDEVVQSCSTCLDVNFDDLESQLGVVLGKVKHWYYQVTSLNEKTDNSSGTKAGTVSPVGPVPVAS